jgi:L-lactate dehydrogenase complex protein LldG
VPLPEAFAGSGYPNLLAQFDRSVAEVGAHCVFLEEGETVAAALLRIPEYASARRVASLLPEIGNVDLTAVSDPHQLDDVEFCVLPADLAVAENGACWITDHGKANRAVCFLAQHIAVVVSSSRIVANLHQAYAQLELPRRGFSMWLSGPSKTADIEQALVIGAHGPRSCTVIVTRNP